MVNDRRASIIPSPQGTREDPAREGGRYSVLITFSKLNHCMLYTANS